MPGFLAIVLHAHLPFVRHPEHEHFLEESWLFEAIVESYLPLIEVMDGWQAEDIDTRLTLTLTPTLCSMLRDPLLQERFRRHLRGLVELSEKETHRTHWDECLAPLAEMYHTRFTSAQRLYDKLGGDLVGAFRRFQDLGKIEIITCAATHALLPLLDQQPQSVRAQILMARDHYRECFGRDPAGIWLPECAYVDGVENVLQEANIRWFIIDTHGLLHARPRPRYGVFAPIFTPNGIAAFGRDLESAKQVWSRHEGYPGDPRYRDFYRDIAFDLDYDYVRPYFPAPPQRSFTGIKYHRITGGDLEKEPYDPDAATEAAAKHAEHFLSSRVAQVEQLNAVMDREPLLVAPYDAELFGHWWYEGPQFLDLLARKIASGSGRIKLTTPGEFLAGNPALQVAKPSSSSWGEEGYWRVWLNESNEWIYPHLDIAGERMTELARQHPHASGLTERALKQAGRELMLAQASDWPFILRTGTSPDYARKRVTDHLLRFIALHEQLTSTSVDGAWLKKIEDLDNLFPNINYRWWA